MTYVHPQDGADALTIIGQESGAVSAPEGHLGTAYGWLRHHAGTRPDARAVTEWRDGVAGPWLTYADTCRTVDEVARGLRQHGVGPGDRVVIALPNGTPFYCSVIACIAMGAVAVPAPAPGLARTTAFRERIDGVIADCAPALLITEPGLAGQIAEITGDRCPVASFEPVREAGLDPGGSPWPAEPPSPVAVLQYTSGSTGRPRGIVVTHEALRASCAQAAQAYRERASDVGITWVPLYHDLGLVTGVMRPLFSGYPSVLLRASEFVQRPQTWLEAIGACGGTLSSGPNFAYELCVRKIAPERAAGLNLRTWRVARNAGEVVRSETVDRFCELFAAAGFSGTAMCTGYGLAEATLTVTTCTPQVRPLRLPVLRSDLQSGVVTPVDGRHYPDQPVQTLLSSGVPLAGTSVMAGDGRIGAVSIRGPQVAAARWADGEHQPHGGGEGDAWYDTGDLGFIHDGHLFVVGRADDTIVYHGRNFYLADVAAACKDIAQLRPGRVVAFTTRDPVTDTDGVCVVAELRPQAEPAPETLAALALETKRRLASALELFAAQVEFVAAGTLPVTTSGKLRASEVRRRFEAGCLPLLLTVSRSR